MPLVKLLGEKLLAAGGRSVPTREAFAGASAVGLYFSASWCPPCRGFTPQLIKSHDEVLHQKGFRCVLISRDRDLESFQQYFSDMPWLALPYDEQERNASLGEKFGVKTIPSLALVDLQGKTITADGRDSVMRDPEGAEYPWHPPLVRDLGQGNPGRLNELPSLVLLCEAATSEQQQEALKEMTNLATAWSQESEKEFGFFIASSGPMAARVRELCQLPSDGAPQLLLVDIPDNGGFYLGPALHQALEEQGMRSTLKDYSAKTLDRKQLKS